MYRKVKNPASFNPSELSGLHCPRGTSVVVAGGLLCHCLVWGLSGTRDLVTSRSRLLALRVYDLLPLSFRYEVRRARNLGHLCLET